MSDSQYTLVEAMRHAAENYGGFGPSDIYHDIMAFAERLANLPGFIPEGWKLVPTEPTKEMLDGMTTATFLNDGSALEMHRRYNGMLGHVPKLPAIQGCNPPLPVKPRTPCGDPNCGCHLPTLTDPLQAVYFLCGRMRYAGIAASVAESYAQDLEDILHRHGIDPEGDFPPSLVPEDSQ